MPKQLVGNLNVADVVVTGRSIDDGVQLSGGKVKAGGDCPGADCPADWPDDSLAVTLPVSITLPISNEVGSVQLIVRFWPSFASASLNPVGFMVDRPGAGFGMLVIAAADTIDVRRMVDTARRLNPRIEIVLRAHGEDEVRLFEEDALGKVFVGEHELALGITRHILERMGMHPSDQTSPPR